MRGRFRVPQIWTLPSRRVVLGIVIAFLITLSLLDWRDRAAITDPQPSDGVRSNELADRIDPNTADAPTLSALPTLGEKRAKEIVAYRQAFTTMHPQQQPFLRPEDLTKIRGIGEATVRALEPYLIFPGPASHPISQSTSHPIPLK